MTQSHSRHFMHSDLQSVSVAYDSVTETGKAFIRAQVSNILKNLNLQPSEEKLKDDLTEIRTHWFPLDLCDDGDASNTNRLLQSIGASLGSVQQADISGLALDLDSIRMIGQFAHHFTSGGETDLGDKLSTSRRSIVALCRALKQTIDWTLDKPDAVMPYFDFDTTNGYDFMCFQEPREATHDSSHGVVKDVLKLHFKGTPFGISRVTKVTVSWRGNFPNSIIDADGCPKSLICEAMAEHSLASVLWLRDMGLRMSHLDSSESVNSLFWFFSDRSRVLLERFDNMYCLNCQCEDGYIN